MELFSIICETCQAKLRVRQPEAIGQILECPRCHSMVQVIPPPDWQGESDSPDGLAADNEPDFAAEDQLADQSLSPDAVLPSQLRATWITVAAGVGLLAIAVGLATAWLQSDGAESAHNAMAATDARAALPPSNPPAESPAPAASDDSKEPQADPQPPPEVETPISSSPGEAPPVSTGDSDVATPVVPAPKPAGLPDSGSPTTATSQPEPSAVPANTADSDDAASSGDAVETQATAEGPAPVPQSATNPPPSTAEPPAEQPTSNSPDDPSPSLPTATLQTEDRAGGVSHPIDVRARLADSVRQIDFDAIELADLIDLLVEMTRLPITLDLDALERRGLRATALVSIHLSDTTVAEILAEALTQHGLHYSADDRQVVVTDSRTARAVVRYRVADLVQGDSPAARSAGLERLAKEIQTLVAPATWQSAGGRGTIRVQEDLLEIDQSRAVLYQILVFCEKLRLARGLPLRSRFPASRFPLASRTAQVRDKLDRPVTITFIQPTPLPEVAQYVHHVTGLTIAIDWRRLLPEGIAPSAEITCGVTDKPLEESLSALLSPLGLGWRVVNADSIQLVTQADAEGRLEVEFYPVGDDVQAAGQSRPLVDRLRKEVSSNSWTGTGGKGVAVYDPPSGHLIVLQTQPIQRQVEQWLMTPPTSP
jgi:hypothetical protein